MKILFIGDVVGMRSCEALKKALLAVSKSMTVILSIFSVVVIILLLFHITSLWKATALPMILISSSSLPT